MAKRSGHIGVVSCTDDRNELVGVVAAHGYHYAGIIGGVCSNGRILGEFDILVHGDVVFQFLWP